MFLKWLSPLILCFCYLQPESSYTHSYTMVYAFPLLPAILTTTYINALSMSKTFLPLETLSNAQQLLHYWHTIPPLTFYSPAASSNLLTLPMLHLSASATSCQPHTQFHQCHNHLNDKWYQYTIGYKKNAMWLDTYLILILELTFPTYPEGLWYWYQDGLQESSKLKWKRSHLHSLLINFFTLH